MEKIKKLSKWQIAVACESLPGVKPWSSMSLMTVNYDHFTRSELVDIYNDYIDRYSLQISKII